MHVLTDQWWQLFVNRTDGTLRASAKGWRFDPRELVPEELSQALDERQALGVYAADREGSSRWVCLDADTDSGKQALGSLAVALNRHASLFEVSRRGAHLWLFCPPMPWGEARAVGLDLARQAGIDCEVFPKGPGRNGVRLPLTPHPKTGLIYPVVDPATGEIPDERACLALRPAPLPPVKLPRRDEHRAWQIGGAGSYGDLAKEIGKHTRLRQYGPERANGRCPFHQHPSLSVLGGFWRCWAGCGEGGIAAFRALVNKHERR
jgi:hypothetical protein